MHLLPLGISTRRVSAFAFILALVDNLNLAICDMSVYMLFIFSLQQNKHQFNMQEMCIQCKDLWEGKRWDFLGEFLCHIDKCLHPWDIVGNIYSRLSLY